MANVYVRSGAAGAGTGADWANAYTTLAAAFAAKAAGDNFWIAGDHAETQGSAMTLTSPGTAAAPCTVICVNHAGTVPPVSADLLTTATITTTGNFALTVGAGHTYWYGVALSAGSGAVAPQLVIGSVGPSWNYFKSCKLIKAGTSGGSPAMTFGGAAFSFITFDNTTLQFGSTGDSVRHSTSKVIYKNTASAIAGATIPTSLFKFTSTFRGTIIFDGYDLSAITGTIFDLAASNGGYEIFLKDCKTAVGAVISTTPLNPAGPDVHVVRSDSGATNYRQEKYSYMGTQTVETTIVRTLGASDGATPIAWKIVTTANAKWILPFESELFSVWNDTVGSSVTVTVYGIWGGVAVPTAEDIWIEGSYLGSALTPQASFATATKADYLATGAALTADAISAWGGSVTPFKMTLTFTPNQKGRIYLTAKAKATSGGASQTFYICPKPALS